MRWSPERFRWLALGGAMLLAGVVAAFFGLASYRAGKVWQRILKRNGVNLVQESNGLTYSQSVRGRTVFTLHAEKSTPRGNGVYGLHNAVLILYGKDGRDDRISGNDFEYDQGQGILRAMGEVHMDLQAPTPAGGEKQRAGSFFSFLPDDRAAADPEVVHVRTSGLVYLRKSDVAATRDPVEFSYRGLQGESLGAEFDSGQSALHLLAQVHIRGNLQNQAFVLAAERADLDRAADQVTLEMPEWTTGTLTGRADRGLLHLRRDGSLDQAHGIGHVFLREGTRSLAAAETQVQFGLQSRVERSLFTGGVAFDGTDAAETVHGTAGRLLLQQDGRGLLHDAAAEGGVNAHAEQAGAGSMRVQRDLHSERATADFSAVPGSKEVQLQTLHLLGSAQVLSITTGPHSSRSAIWADGIVTDFSSGLGTQPEPQHLLAEGHTDLQQGDGEGRHQRSEGDRLEVQFSASPEAGGAHGAVEVSEAVQTGHVVVHTWPATVVAQGHLSDTVSAQTPSVGHAERAVYRAAEEAVQLFGGSGTPAEVEDGTAQITAPQITLQENSGDGEATGGVATTFLGQNGGAATHVLAARGKLTHALQTAEFFGSDAEPAQLWQGTSQIMAANVLLDSRRHTLTARPQGPSGRVRGVFAAERSPTASVADPETAGTEARDDRRAGPSRPAQYMSGAHGDFTSRTLSAASSDAVRVAANALDYSDLEHEATFSGQVVLQNASGTVSAEHGAAFFQAGPQTIPGKPASVTSTPTAAAGGLGGRLDRFVLLGKVRLQQPGRNGQGEHLTYTAATDRFVLTGAPGAPPQISDEREGAVSGETLLFTSGENSVVVSGPGRERERADGVPAERRVHTETDLKR